MQCNTSSQSKSCSKRTWCSLTQLSWLHVMGCLLWHRDERDGQWGRVIMDKYFRELRRELWIFWSSHYDRFLNSTWLKTTFPEDFATFSWPNSIANNSGAPVIIPHTISFFQTLKKLTYDALKICFSSSTRLPTACSSPLPIIDPLWTSTSMTFLKFES